MSDIHESPTNSGETPVAPATQPAPADAPTAPVWPAEPQHAAAPAAPGWMPAEPQHAAAPTAPAGMPVEPPWSPSPAAAAAPLAAAAGSGGAQWPPPPTDGGPAGPWGPPPPSGGAPGYPYGAWGPAPDPAHSPAPAGNGKGKRAVATVGALMVVAASLGLGIGIGSGLHRQSPVSSAAAVLPVTPTSPSTIDPSTGILPSPSTGDGSTSSPSTGGTSTQAAAIAAKVDAAVVDINTRLGYQGASAAGTGMVLSSTGEILTNNHVVDGATSITATLVTTGRTYTAKVVGTDPTADVAIIQLQGASGLKTISTAGTPAQGDTVIAIGNAGGAGGTPSVVTGTVQALNQTITASDQNGANAEQLSDLIQTDAPIQPGDSGGPLVNTSGKVIGIDTAASGGNQLSSTASVGFAVPISDALSVARQIESRHASSTIHLGLPGFLGVAVAPDGTTNGSGTSSSGGAVVSSVASGTPAEAAGLTQGDTITAIDNQTVDSAQTLSTLTRSHQPGDQVTVSWTDQSGASHTATVTLVTGPAD